MLFWSWWLHGPNANTVNVDLEPYIYRPHPIYRLPSREDAATTHPPPGMAAVKQNALGGHLWVTTRRLRNRPTTQNKMIGRIGVQLVNQQ
mgnify:CR=1 FL=1